MRTVNDNGVDLSAYHPGEVSWEEDGYTVTRNTQWSGPGCHDGCAVLFYTKDNKLVKVEGDPCAPYNKGRLCMRCLALPEMVNHPDRVMTPLRRAGERGENKWEPITWDEAMTEVTDKCKHYLKTYGPQSIALAVGTGRNAFWEGLGMCIGAIGSTNAIGYLSSDTCYVPRMAAMATLLGGAAVADCAQMYEASFDDPRYVVPDYMLIWGNNPIRSNGDGFFGHWVVDLMKRGTKLIVVDPQVTWLAAHAEHCIQLRPGTDGACALAMLNVVINEELYDHDFVDCWCYGFDELRERVQEWPPERAAEVCGVDAADITAAARAFAGANVASVQWGLAVDTHTHGVAAAQAIADLWAICGYVDVPGGCVMPSTGYTTNDLEYALVGIGPDYTSPTPDNQLYDGWEEYPLRTIMPASLGDKTLEDIENGGHTKMFISASSNGLANAGADAKRWYEALQKIEYHVVMDLFITPTASAAADMILPVAMSCERNGIRDWWAPFRAMSKVIETDENGPKSDEEIILEFGRRMRPEVFTWDNDKEFLNWLIPQRNATTFTGTFDDLVEQIYYYEPYEYRKFETGKMRKDGNPGFETGTGRIELFSNMFGMMGLDPLPYHKESRFSPLTTPELMEEYPFVLTTGRRSWEFFHSEHRQSAYMREFHPDPIVEVNPKDAERIGVRDGDWMWMQNMHGKCKQRVKVTPTMKEGVLSAEHGWWFPERDGSAKGGFFGTFESNINCLTPMGDTGPTGYGAPYKNQICKAYPVTEENDTTELTEEEYRLSVESRMVPRFENAFNY